MKAIQELVANHVWFRVQTRHGLRLALECLSSCLLQMIAMYQANFQETATDSFFTLAKKVPMALSRKLAQWMGYVAAQLSVYRTGAGLNARLSAKPSLPLTLQALKVNLFSSKNLRE